MLNVMNRRLIERNAQATLEFAKEEGNPASNLVLRRTSKVFFVFNLVVLTAFNFVLLPLGDTSFDGTFCQAAMTALSMVVLSILLGALFHYLITQFLRRAEKGRVHLWLMFLAFAAAPIWMCVAFNLQDYVNDYGLWTWSNTFAGIIVAYYEIDVAARLFSKEPVGEV